MAGKRHRVRRRNSQRRSRSKSRRRVGKRRTHQRRSRSLEGYRNRRRDNNAWWWTKKSFGDLVSERKALYEREMLKSATKCETAKNKTRAEQSKFQQGAGDGVALQAWGEITRDVCTKTPQSSSAPTQYDREALTQLTTARLGERQYKSAIQAKRAKETRSKEIEKRRQAHQEKMALEWADIKRRQAIAAEERKRQREKRRAESEERRFVGRQERLVRREERKTGRAMNTARRREGSAEKAEERRRKAEAMVRGSMIRIAGQVGRDRGRHAMEGFSPLSYSPSPRSPSSGSYQSFSSESMGSIIPRSSGGYRSKPFKTRKVQKRRTSSKKYRKKRHF